MIISSLPIKPLCMMFLYYSEIASTVLDVDANFGCKDSRNLRTLRTYKFCDAIWSRINSLVSSWVSTLQNPKRLLSLVLCDTIEMLFEWMSSQRSL
jgi:hypothetical protein